MTFIEKLIHDTEPESSLTLIRTGRRAAVIQETGERVIYNASTGWLCVLDEDGFWVDKYKPVYHPDGTIRTYEDYYGIKSL